MFMEVIGYFRFIVVRVIKYFKDNNWIDIVKVGSVMVYCVNV